MSGSEITYSYACAHLSEVLDRVGHDRQIITVTCRNQPDLALIVADVQLTGICLLTPQPRQCQTLISIDGMGKVISSHSPNPKKPQTGAIR
jgi:hypothetical protein